MASIEASASANADKFYSKYLQLAYSYPSSRQPSRESQFATPEDLEFAEADENLLQRLSLAEDAAAYEQIQEKVGSCQMKLYTRDVGDWHQEFWSRFVEDDVLELRNVVSNVKYLGEKKLELKYDKTLGEAASVFTSALVICNLLLDPDSILFPFRSHGEILELGSGTGVFGLAAALLGANVVMTDRECVLPQIRRNMEENLPDGCKARVEVLDWGTEASRTYDIVVCSDCVYISALHRPLVRTMHSLCGENSVVVLAFERRNPESEEIFLSHAKEVFEVTEHSHSYNEDVRLFTCRRITTK